MAAVTSTMQALGSAAHAFNLPDTTQGGSMVSLDTADDKPVLVMFICNHCPYVIHLIEALTEIANQAQRDGFAVYAISSNDVENYPQDSPAKMADFARAHGFEFPYLYDQTQDVAHAYAAACTPDFFAYDGGHHLVYRGQFDGSRPGNSQAVKGSDLLAGLSAAKNGGSAPEPQVPSIGCSIKWLSGNQPNYG